MIIGVPKEIKVHEYRVGLTPASVRELAARGHLVFVESGAGAGIGMDDDAGKGVRQKKDSTLVRAAEDQYGEPAPPWKLLAARFRDDGTVAAAFDYGAMAATVLALLVLCALVDAISTAVRRALR